MRNKVLLNAIIGDICGSIYEWHSVKEKPENLIDPRCDFTDDTVHTIAIAEAILNNPDNPDFKGYLIKWSRKYPGAGYGQMMCNWIDSENPQPYGSFGNGSAMRVSACGWVRDLDKSNELAIKSAEVTHNHPEGIKGAKVVAELISGIFSIQFSHNSIGFNFRNPDFLKGRSVIRLKTDYPNYPIKFDEDGKIINNEEYNKYKSSYKWSSTCQGSVPQSINCVSEATSYEDAIKLAISWGGDADTMACIAGSIAGVIWEKPDELVDFAYKKLPKEMISIVEDFDKFIKLDE